MRINIKFSRIGIIYMLKNCNIYCFIFEDSSTGKRYLLNGGKINKLDQYDINYYYKNMIYYSNGVREILNSYHCALKNMSDYVKNIGGDGTIHGCIIDIDFYNHIYVNLSDGTITPYYAISIVDKYLYKNIKALLYEQRKDLYDNYIKNLNNKSIDEKLFISEATNTINFERPLFITDTYMYKYSRVLKSLQYLTENNIIRTWSDQFINIMHISKTNDEKTGFNVGNFLIK